MGDSIEHCVAKIVAIVDSGHEDRKSLLQLGYNLGRLSELTGLGREPFWDAWKGPVETWNCEAMRGLAAELSTRFVRTGP